MGQNLQTGLLALGAVLAVALGRALPAVFAGGMPQAPGEDVVALILGDARQELSNTLLDKAEDYFHGGVRSVACESGLTGESGGHEHGEHEPAPEGKARGGGFDPWSWIDASVHEQTDRHLAREQAAELLPWFWAACRVSPRNEQAVLTGSYVLASMAKKPEAGVRLLEDGIRNNPASAELEFSLGEVLFHTLHDGPRAEPHFLLAREKARPADGPAGEEGRILKLRTLFYLGYLAKQRGEEARVRAYLAEAEAVNPGHACTRDLRKLLQKAE